MNVGVFCTVCLVDMQHTYEMKGILQHAGIYHAQDQTYWHGKLVQKQLEMCHIYVIFVPTKAILVMLCEQIL